jgi:hypothetical protein
LINRHQAHPGSSPGVLFLSLDIKPLRTMNYIKIPDYVIDSIILSLQQGVDVCLNVDSTSEETEKSPYFSNGYSRATMQGVIEDLNQYKELSN